MASTYSLRFRLNFQAPGDNLNIWGTVLNTGVFQLLEDAIARRVALTISGPVSLTSNNGAADQARCAFLDVTAGTGGTITAPAVEKLYVLRNASTGNVVLTTGSGVSATFIPGEIGWAIGDGTNFYKEALTDFAGAALTNVGAISGLATPTATTQAANKGYVDSAISAAAFSMGTFGVPITPSNAGQYLTNNGSTPSWAPAVAALAGLSGSVTAAAAKTALAIATSDITDSAAKQASAQQFAVCMALLF